MTLLSYQVFMAVVEEESFQKAAQALQLTPSAISHAVAGMEAELGSPLFIRSKQGVYLTNYGKEPIFEVELELFSGETEELVELGEQLQEKYGLEVQELSKYARGIELIKKGKREAKEAAAAGREQAAQYHSER